MSVSVQGSHDPKFAAVVERFEKNFTELGDVGASSQPREH